MKAFCCRSFKGAKQQTKQHSGELRCFLFSPVLCLKLWLITFRRRDLWKTNCASYWTRRQRTRNVEQHMVTIQVDAGSSLCGGLCRCRVGVTDKILSRENIYACVFIYTRQASVVKEVWTDSLRRRIVFTQLGFVLFLIHSPYGAYAHSHWTLF